MYFKEFDRVLAVYAHPDDAEFLFGGTIALLTARGADVNYVCCTDGRKSGPDAAMSEDDVAATRASEQRAAADVLGVNEITFLGYANGTLEVTEQLRRDIVRQIRRHKPQLILAMDPRRAFDTPIEISHREHLNAGEATLAAAFPEAGTSRMYPELADEGLSPHRVDDIWIATAEGANRYIDTTDVIEQKIRAFQCHVSQYGERPGRPAWTFEDPKWSPMSTMMRAAGQMVAAEFAESFRAVRTR